MRRSFCANSKCKNCVLKDPLVRNNQYMTFKDLDTLECIHHGDVIIPTTNILKRHEASFNMMGIDPVVLQNTKLKKATLDDDMD